ncbi:MAG: D-tyrosyl-tRNA(Tyr) deacylase [Proteobacteria bacterium]|nr:D-tyrosyl-tRNA(Tyr) deacylase [Pseudomonadota bacterium]
MRAHVQRVSACEVRVGGSPVSAIGKGLLVLLGVAKGDSEEEALKLAKKVVSLRIFEDGNGRMNLSVRDVNGEVMVVSQFTLLADTSRGNRPGFADAEEAGPGKVLYERFCDAVSLLEVPVRRGRFGASMEVALVNDGPVTILLESPKEPVPVEVRGK